MTNDTIITLILAAVALALAFGLELARRRWLKRQSEAWERLQPEIDEWTEAQRRDFVDRYGIDPFADYIDAEEEIGSDVDTVVIEREEKDTAEEWDSETDRVGDGG